MVRYVRTVAAGVLVLSGLKLLGMYLSTLLLCGCRAGAFKGYGPLQSAARETGVSLWLCTADRGDRPVPGRWRIRPVLPVPRRGETPFPLSPAPSPDPGRTHGPGGTQCWA